MNVFFKLNATFQTQGEVTEEEELTNAEIDLSVSFYFYVALRKHAKHTKQ